MASFLQLLAKDIIRKYGTDFADLTIIFPNKRAGLFLAEELSRQIDRPVWMPEILTLTEYIEKHSGLKKAETLSLIIKLYNLIQPYQVLPRNSKISIFGEICYWLISTISTNTW